MLVLSVALIFGLFQSPSIEDYLKANQAYIKESQSEEKLVALVSILYQYDQNARAIALLQPFVKTNTKASRAKLFLALGYAREEKYEQGRLLAAQVAAATPKDHYAQYVLGLTLFGLNRFDEAEVRFKRAVDLKPDLPDAHFQLGQLHARKPGELEAAKTSFQRAFDAGYRTLEIYKSLASVSLKLGQLENATEHLNAALKLDPNYPEAYFLLADALRKSGSPEKAVAAMQQFQTLNASAMDRRARETKSKGLYQEGMSFLANDDLVKAYQAFKQALDALPQLDTAHYRVAQIEYLRDNNPQALKSIRSALELNPFEPEYYFVLARCLETADLAAATQAAAKAVLLNPTVADFHNLLGNLFTKTGDFANAVSSYRRAIDLDPKNGAYRSNLTAAQQRLPKK